MMEHKHNLSKGLCSALVVFSKQKMPANPNKLKLTHNQLANWQKLRYWGLVEKVKEEGESIGGMWQLTPMGVLFVRNKISIQKWAWTYRGKVLRLDGDKVSIDQVLETYKTKPEYVADAQPVHVFDDDQRTLF